MAQGNIYKPRNNISNRTRSKIITYKNGYLRRFYERRSRRVKRGGLFCRFVLVANNRKWKIARRFIRPIRRYAGQHIKNARSTINGRPRKRLYINSFLQKQRLRHFYGNRKESAFASFFAHSNRIQGISSESFFSRLESRLDRTFYRRRLFPTLYGCRQFMQHHGILLNSVKETSPNVQVQIGDTLSIPTFAWKQLYWDLYCRAYYRRWGHFISVRRFYSRFKKKLIHFRSITARRSRPSFRTSRLFKKNQDASYLQKISKRSLYRKMLKRVNFTRFLQMRKLSRNSFSGRNLSQKIKKTKQVNQLNQSKKAKIGTLVKPSKLSKYLSSISSELLSQNKNLNLVASFRRIRSLALRRRFKQRVKRRFSARVSFRKGMGFRSSFRRFSRRNPQKRKWLSNSSSRTTRLLFSLFSKAEKDGGFGKSIRGIKKRTLKSVLSHSNSLNRKGYLLLSGRHAMRQNNKFSKSNSYEIQRAKKKLQDEIKRKYYETYRVSRPNFLVKENRDKRKKFQVHPCLVKRRIVAGSFKFGLSNVSKRFTSKKVVRPKASSSVYERLALFSQQTRAEEAYLSRLSNSITIDHVIRKALQNSNMANLRMIKTRKSTDSGDKKKISTPINLAALMQSFSNLGNNEVSIIARKRRQLHGFMLAQNFRKLLLPKYVKNADRWKKVLTNDSFESRQSGIFKKMNKASSSKRKESNPFPFYTRSERQRYLRRRLARFLRRWRRRVRRNHSYPRLNSVHRYFPSYFQLDLRTLRTVKMGAAPASQVYTGFRLSPSKIYAFYKSRGF